MKKNKFNSLVGKILIASPNLRDDKFFERSVIYIFMHNENGAFGVILNQKIDEIDDNQLNNIFNQAHNKEISTNTENKKHKTIPIMLGGPVNTQFYMALITAKNKAIDKDMKNNKCITLYLNMKVFIDDYLANDTVSDCLLIKGMSAWEPGQIEEEIKCNEWFIAEPDVNIIFSKQPEKRWWHHINELGLNKGLFIAPYTGNA